VMRQWKWGLLFVSVSVSVSVSALVSASSFAQRAPEKTPEDWQQPNVIEQPRRMVRKPAMEAIESAFSATDLPWAFVIARIDYDSSGSPIGVTLDPPTGDAALDSAIRAWAEQSRVSPGRLPRERFNQQFVLLSEAVNCEGVDAPDSSCARDYRLRDIEGSLLSPLAISMFAMWSEDEAEITLYFEHDASGRLLRLVPNYSRGPIPFSDWILDKDVRLKTTHRGYGRLRFRLAFVSDAREARSKAGDDVVAIWKTSDNDRRLLVDKGHVQSQIAIHQQMLPANVPGDPVRLRIDFNAQGLVVGIEPETRDGEDPAQLRAMLESLLLEARVKSRPRGAGSRRVTLYPDGSVLPAD